MANAKPAMIGTLAYHLEEPSEDVKVTSECKTALIGDSGYTEQT